MKQEQALLQARKYAEELRCVNLWLQQHDKQKEASKVLKMLRALFWGNRVGKTHWGAQEVCRYVFNAHEHKKVQLPIEVWCACPSFDQQKETTQKKLLAMIPEHRIVDKTYLRKDVLTEIKLDNGSKINFKSYEQGREKFQGTGKRLIWFDEEPPKDIFDEAMARMEAGIPLDFILTMTPINGMTWVYDEIYLNTDNPNYYVSTASWDDNPWLTQDQVSVITSVYDAESLQVRKYGKFLKRVGLVCSWFDRSVHLKDVIYPQSNWNIYKVIDFGWSSSKTCVLWIGVDSTDQIYIFDGIYSNEMGDDELASIMKKKEAEMGIKTVKTIADNTPDRINTLKLNGIHNIVPIEKMSGSNQSWDEFRTEQMNKVGKIEPITKKSRLHISAALTDYDVDEQRNYNYFVNEVESLRWKEQKVSGEVKSKSEWDKDRCPIKGAHFDALDCFSYFCVEYLRAGERYTEQKTEEEVRKHRERIRESFEPVNDLTGF
jgi:phage terminase large subunit-like protein